MNLTGIGNIAIGIVVIAVGVTAGILTIISGANLIRAKKNLLF